MIGISCLALGEEINDKLEQKGSMPGKRHAIF